MSNGHLGDQDDVGAAGHAGVQRDPAGVPAHHLDDQRAVVRLGGRVQPVDRLHRDVDRGVEAERVVGGVEVVVDRLGYADDVHAVLVQLGGDAEGVLAADRDQGVDAELLEVRLDLLDAAVDLERVGARRAEDRAAARQDAAHLLDAERRSSGPRSARASRRGSRRTRGRRPSTPLRTTARMTAFRPGQSPPPVSTPIRMGATLEARLGSGHDVLSRRTGLGDRDESAHERRSRSTPARPASRRWSSTRPAAWCPAGTRSSRSTSRSPAGSSTSRSRSGRRRCPPAARRCAATTAAASPRSASPTSARPRCSGTGRRSPPRAAPSSGRTAARPRSATGCARPGTRTGSAS